MLPTPAKLHYLFNLRDISKVTSEVVTKHTQLERYMKMLLCNFQVFQGLLRSHKDYQNTKSSLLRLWVHECFRVFNDRLIDIRYELTKEMTVTVSHYFTLTR